MFCSVAGLYIKRQDEVQGLGPLPPLDPLQPILFSKYILRKTRLFTLRSAGPCVMNSFTALDYQTLFYTFFIRYVTSICGDSSSCFKDKFGRIQGVKEQMILTCLLKSSKVMVCGLGLILKLLRSPQRGVSVHFVVKVND